jgi:hypothetical protein
MEANRVLKANPKLAGLPCGWCQTALALGDDSSVCNTCERSHHAKCWEQRAGCAGAGCLHAPLRQLEPVVPIAAAPEGYLRCPECRGAARGDRWRCRAG